MKKLALSVFALLAIVFAISSAFTTAKKNMPTETKYRAYEVLAANSTSASSIVTTPKPALTGMSWQTASISDANLTSLTLSHFSETVLADACDGDDDFYCTVAISAQVDNQTYVSGAAITQIKFGLRP